MSRSPWPTVCGSAEPWVWPNRVNFHTRPIRGGIRRTWVSPSAICSSLVAPSSRRNRARHARVVRPDPQIPSGAVDECPAEPPGPVDVVEVDLDRSPLWSAPAALAARSTRPGRGCSGAAWGVPDLGACVGVRVAGGGAAAGDGPPSEVRDRQYGRRRTVSNHLGEDCDHLAAVPRSRHAAHRPDRSRQREDGAHRRVGEVRVLPAGRPVGEQAMITSAGSARGSRFRIRSISSSMPSPAP